MTCLDHIVIAADSLQQGLDYCEEILGIRPPKGGEHERIGTHNHLLYLGEETFLEVIAINPLGKIPSRPRWFGLDSPSHRARVACRPYLSTFVARTTDIVEAASALPQVGRVQDMARGTLHWKITIPDDGLLVESGTVPTVIEWPPGVEATKLMPDLGYRLRQLEAYHPHPQTLQNTWDKIGLSDPRLSICACGPAQEPYLVAYIETPNGLKMISGLA